MALHNIKSRHYQLFKLLAEESSYRPASYFKNRLSVSLKTIYNDIDELKKVMTPYHLSIRKVPRNGMILIGTSMDIEKFHSDLLADLEQKDTFYSPSTRRIWILKEVLLNDQHPSIETIEQKFFVTSASIRVDIAWLQEMLMPFHVNIHTIQQCIYIDGDESAIQKAFKMIFLNIVKQKDSYDVSIESYPLQTIVHETFSKELIDLSLQEIHYLSSITGMNISQYYMSSLWISILIQISRLNQNHHIENREINHTDISYMQSYMIAYDLAEQIEKKFGLNFEEQDIEYLCEQLYAHRIESQNTEPIVKQEFTTIVDDMILCMSKILEVELSDDVKLRNSLMAHIPAMIYRMKRGIKITNSLLTDIKKQYMVLFSLTRYVASNIEHKYNITLNDDEISFLSIYFQVSLEKRHGLSFRNIVIVCPIGLAMSELILAKVRQFIPNRDNIITMSVDELYKSDLSRIDFIISTINLKPLEAPVVYVSPLMSDEDIEHIMHTYSHLNRIHSSLSKIHTEDTIDFSECFNEEFLFTQMEFQNKRECLDFLIQNYENAMLVDSTFGKSIYEREALGDTGLYTGVAMPHALPETVMKTQISIMTLKDKIRWGVNDVRMILMIAVAQPDIDHIGGMITKILAIIESNETLNRLLQVDSRQVLYAMLKDIYEKPNNLLERVKLC